MSDETSLNDSLITRHLSPMTRHWSDRELYTACGQDGSELQRQAFATLYQELYLVCLFMLQTATLPEPQELAQDCAQEAVVKIWKHLATCTQPESFRSWAKTIARNQTLNEIAKLKRKREETLEHALDKPQADQRALPDAALTKHERYLAVLDLLASAPISERSRYVILAKYLLNLTEEEISRALSEKEGAEVRPSHVQVTRAKNFKKLYSDPEVHKKFEELDSDV
jgi:RNA polymerase sigma factor (sigma-70 family)